MEVRRIIIAIHERRKWLDRQGRVERELALATGTERRLREEELRRIKEQVAYYTRLTREIKMRIRPSHVSQLLDRL